MIRDYRTVPAALIAAALTLGASGNALADDGMDLYLDEVADDAGELSADDVSDEHLENFVIASQALRDVRAERVSMIEELEGEDAQEMMEEAAEAMANGVEATGLSIEEYRQIGYLIRNDDELMERLEEAAGNV